MPRYAMPSVNIGGNSTTTKYEGEYRKGPYSNTYGNKNTGSSYSGGSSYRGSSGGGSRGGSRGGSSSVSVSTPAAPAANPYVDYLQSWYDQQRAAAEEAERRKREAAQAAYDRGMAALGNAYNSQLSSLQGNYDSSLETLQNSYDSGVRGTNQQADRTMNEAYVNYMLTRRDLPQLLAAQGVNGGAAESTYASLANNYGNSRNEIDTGRNDTLADLLDQLNANKASALQAFNASKSDLEAQKMAYQMELENALAQQIVSAANTKFDTLQNIGSQYLTQAAQIAQEQQAAAQAAAARSYTASNTYRTSNTQQGASGGGSTASGGGLSAYAQQVRNWYAQGATDNQVAQQLMASGLTNDQISQIMASIY